MGGGHSGGYKQQLSERDHRSGVGRHKAQKGTPILTCSMIPVSFVPSLLQNVVRDAEKHANVQRIYHVLVTRIHSINRK